MVHLTRKTVIYFVIFFLLHYNRVYSLRIAHQMYRLDFRSLHVRSCVCVLCCAFIKEIRAKFKLDISPLTVRSTIYFFFSSLFLLYRFTTAVSMSKIVTLMICLIYRLVFFIFDFVSFFFFFVLLWLLSVFSFLRLKTVQRIFVHMYFSKVFLKQKLFCVHITCFSVKNT